MLIARPGKIIIKRDEHTTITDGGIHLAGKARQPAHRGIVLSAGESEYINDGDYVLFTAFAGNTIHWEGEKIYIADEKLVLAVLT